MFIYLSIIIHIDFSFALPLGSTAAASFLGTPTGPGLSRAPWHKVEVMRGSAT